MKEKELTIKEKNKIIALTSIIKFGMKELSKLSDKELKRKISNLELYIDGGTNPRIKLFVSHVKAKSLFMGYGNVSNKIIKTVCRNILEEFKLEQKKRNDNEKKI